MGRLRLVTAAVVTFNEVPIRTDELDDGRKIWRARDVGCALGYADGGAALIKLIHREWADEFEDGEETVSMHEGRGSLPSQIPGTSGGRAPMWLTEAGLNLVCAKTNKPEGKGFRRWLARELRPLRAYQVRAVAPANAGPSPDPDAKTRALLEREARLGAQMRAQAYRSLARSCRARGMADDQVAVLEVKAAQAATGDDLSAYLPVQVERWWTPTQVAAELGCTVQRVGLLITTLAIRGDERYSRAVMDKAQHSDKVVETWQYNSAGRDLIVHAYAAWKRGGAS